MSSSKPVPPLETVLLIDDDLISRELLAMMIESLGFRAETVEDGSQAIEWLQTSAQAPEWILMDAQMPGLSGEELLLALRGRSEAEAEAGAGAGARTRIAVISGSEAAEALRRQADFFLLKPIGVPALAALFATPGSNPSPKPSLPRKSPRRSKSGSKAPPASALSPAAARAKTPQIALPAAPEAVDPEVLGRLKAMMPAAAVREIYQAVAADLGPRLAALESAMAAGSLDSVRKIAHAIKGGCSMVGLSQAAQAASRLETSNRPETWPKELLQLLATLGTLQDMLSAELL